MQRKNISEIQRKSHASNGNSRIIYGRVVYFLKLFSHIYLFNFNVTYNNTIFQPFNFVNSWEGVGQIPDRTLLNTPFYGVFLRKTL